MGGSLVFHLVALAGVNDGEEFEEENSKREDGTRGGAERGLRNGERLWRSFWVRRLCPLMTLEEPRRI